jgi:phospholipid/cholesterol/gamma-HCH transport system permease protein
MMASPVSVLGARAGRSVEELGRIATYAGLVVRAACIPPFRARAISSGMYDSGVLSLALICGAGLTVGLVLALQLYNTLVRFGAQESLGTAVGLSLIRELGPVLTGLLVTGRAGSATTAEIGAMKATEQLDGLRMMAIDPVHYVVMPRAIALALSMPLLSALFIVFGLAGAYLVGVVLLGLDAGSFVASLERSVTFRDSVAQSLVKSAVFGVLLGFVATYRGFTCEPNASGVSRATTSTVVTASIWILLTDYVITALWGV